MTPGTWNTLVSVDTLAAALRQRLGTVSCLVPRERVPQTWEFIE